MSIEKEANHVMNFLCGFNDANSSISRGAVNFWLEKYSDTVFARGKLRKVVFTMITPEMYNVSTKEI